MNTHYGEAQMRKYVQVNRSMTRLSVVVVGVLILLLGSFVSQGAEAGSTTRKRLTSAEEVLRHESRTESKRQKEATIAALEARFTLGGNSREAAVQGLVERLLKEPDSRNFAAAMESSTPPIGFENKVRRLRNTAALIHPQVESAAHEEAIALDRLEAAVRDMYERTQRERPLEERRAGVAVVLDAKRAWEKSESSLKKMQHSSASGFASDRVLASAKKQTKVARLFMQIGEEALAVGYVSSGVYTLDAARTAARNASAAYRRLSRMIDMKHESELSELQSILDEINLLPPPQPRSGNEGASLTNSIPFNLRTHMMVDGNLTKGLTVSMALSA